MNLWGPEFFTDDALVAEIKEYAQARKEVASRGIASIQGEGRRIEFVGTADSRKSLDTDLREMLAEARRRGLPIGGIGGGAIAVETGLP